MKFTRFLIVFLLLTTFAFLSNCKDGKKNKNPAGPNGNTNNGSMSAVVSGEYTANLQSSTAGGVTEVGMMSALSDFTQGSTTYSLTILIYAAPQTGTFEIVPIGQDPSNKATSLFEARVGNDDTNKRSFWSYSGSVTVSQASNTHLKGTFQFNSRENIPGSPEITITNGSFDVPTVHVE